MICFVSLLSFLVGVGGGVSNSLVRGFCTVSALDVTLTVDIDAVI